MYIEEFEQSLVHNASDEEQVEEALIAEEENGEAPLVSNASDARQLKKAKGKVRNKEKEDLNDLAFILSTRQGRNFVWRLMRKAKVFESTFNGESERFSNFLEGQRNLGVAVFADVMKINPEAYLTMIKEQGERQ